MAQPVRPKNVVIVDAENPLMEIRGEFFWLEDHDRIVMQERQSAYQLGYGEGYADASAAARKQRMVIRYRPPLLRRIVIRGLTLLVVVAFMLTLIGEMLGGNPQP